AEDLAQRLAAAPPRALAEIKALFRSSFDRELAGQVAAETESLQRCALTQDYAEGLRAVLEKRPPRFGEQSLYGASAAAPDPRQPSATVLQSELQMGGATPARE